MASWPADEDGLVASTTNMTRAWRSVGWSVSPPTGSAIIKLVGIENQYYSPEVALAEILLRRSSAYFRTCEAQICGDATDLA
jgi:hypothetical protein